MSKTQGKCGTMCIEVNNNTRQKVREWDNGKIGKGSGQTAAEGNDSWWQEITNDTIQGNSLEVGDFIGGGLVLGTWWWNDSW